MYKLLFTCKILFPAILLLCFSLELAAATRYSVATGNWNSNTTWSSSSGGSSGASFPVAGDNVIIEGGKTITITANAACANVSIANGSTLSVGGFNFTVSATTTVSGIIIFTNTSGTKTMGNVVVSGGTWTSNVAETYAITNLTLSGSIFNGSATGTYNVGTNLSVTSGTTNTFNASTITITGTTLADGTIIFASSTGTKTFKGLLTINAGGTWNSSGNSAFIFNGGITNNGTFTAGTGIYSFTTNSQSINGIVSIPNITITGVTLTNNGILTVSAALAGTGGLTNAANKELHLDFTGIVGITTLTTTAAGNTVEYGFAGSQTIRALTYSNLSISGSGTKTSGGIISVLGNLTITGSSVSNISILNPSTFNFSVSGISTINNFGTFNDNSNTGINTFTDLVTLNNTGTWNTNTITTPANLIFQGGITHNGTVDFAAYAATFTGDQNLLVSNSGNFIFNTGAAAVNSVIVNSNLYLQNSGAGKFQFSGAGNFTISAGATVYNQGIAEFQQIMTGVNATTSVWLNDVNSSLSYQNTIMLLITGVLNASAAGNTVIYNGTGSQTVKDASYYNLILSNARNTNTISVGAISISGSFTKTATFTGGTGISNTSITYNGSSTQTLLSTDNYFVYNNLTINNSSGVSLNNNTTVNGTLTFGNGIITTGTYSLILGNSATVNSAGTGKFINGNLVKGIAAGTTSKTFEIGDALYYTPVLISFSQATTGAGTITARTTSGNHPNINSSAINPNLNVNRYWTLTNSGVTGFSTYDATFSYDNADVDAGADYSSFIVGRYYSSAWSYPVTGLAILNRTQAIGLSTFGDFQIGESSATTAACSYGDNGSTPSVSDFMPCINIPSNPVTISSVIAAHQYITMNVIKGLTYQVYTCNTTSPANQLKLSIYKEGAPSDPAIVFSYSNSGNPCSVSANNVYTSFTAAFSGQIRVLINRKTDCSSTTPAGLTLIVNVSGGSNSTDNQTAAGNNSWIGHLYDGTNSGVPYNGNFANYLGYYTQNETFDETFGTGTNDIDCFSPVLSGGTNRANLETVTYSVRYKMNSTKKGLYIADLGSDDGGRLIVDGALVYNNWSDQSYASKPRVLFSLTGNSSLGYDFYENAGSSRVTFQNLTLVLANTLSANVSQNICLGSAGSAISGDVFGTLPTGITLSGTGYQWTYSTTPAGVRINITSATGATFLPNTSVPPFNVPGTYYIYRNAQLSSINNVNPNPYTALNESNAATIVVNSLPVATFSYANSPYCQNDANPYPTFIGGGVAGNFSSTPGLVFISTTTGQVNLSASTAGTYTVTNTIVASGGCSQVVSTATITISPSLSAGISVSASPGQEICIGTTVTFTAIPTNGGVSPSYQWKLNGTNVGTNNPVYSNSSLANNDIVSCTLTSNATCVTGSPVISNGITVTVNPLLPVSIGISASATTICSGTSVTFTATPVNGGSTPAYQWKLNGSNVGTNSTTYINSTLVNGSTVSCVLTSNASPCASGSPATSNTILITVNPASAGGIISGGISPVCLGESIGTLTLTSYTGTILRWERQINSGGWTSTGGAGNTYTEIPYSAGIWQYRAVVQNGSCTVAYSSIFTATVDANTVAGWVSGSSPPICEGASTGVMTLIGSTGSIIRWEKRVNSGGWINISNTLITYSEIPASGGTWEYRTLVQNGSCQSAYSASYSLNVNPTLTITLGSNPVICRGTSTALLTYSATTGSPSNYTIDFDAVANSAGLGDIPGWGLPGSPISINVPWNILPGTYHGSLTVGTTWPVCTSQVYPISVTVQEISTAGVISGNAAPCQGSSQSYSVPNISGTAYSWSFPAGWVQTGGGTTNSVIVTVGAEAGNIQVTPSNSCGNGTPGFLAVTPEVIPSQAGPISGSTSVFIGSSQIYSVANVSGVTYTWSFPAGWIQTAGGTTNSVTVTVGSGSGNIQVSPSNPCGIGIVQSLAVSVITTLLDPTTISANPNVIYPGYSGQIILTAAGGGASGAVLKWYAGGCGTGTSIGSGSPLSINAPSATTVYYVRWESGIYYSNCLNTTVTVNNIYRSKNSGNWNVAGTWEIQTNSGWVTASVTPSSADGTISIRSPHIVTVPAVATPIAADEITIDAGGKLIVNVSTNGYNFNLLNGTGTDLTVNGTFEYQDDIVQFISGATMSVNSGGRFQQNLSYSGNYPITIPTAAWDINSTCEILSCNQLPVTGGLSQTFGNFTWNYAGQTVDINLGGSLSSVRGNLTIAASGAKQLQLTNTTGLTLDIGNDLIIQNGILNFSSGAAPVKIINLSGNYNQTGGTFNNANANLLTINFKGTGKTFTLTSGTLTNTYINWDINSIASLTLKNNLPVAAARTCIVNGSLDCGVNTAVTGAGLFTLSDAATLIMGSPEGISSDLGTGNIQTTTCTLNPNADYTYNGITSQSTGNRLTSVIRDLTINNSTGIALSVPATINGKLILQNGAFSIGNNTLTFQNSDIPIVKNTGTITTTGFSNLVFGTAGNTGGASFVIPAGCFTTPPTINNLTVNRVNNLSLSDQTLSIRGVMLCNGPFTTGNKLVLLSSSVQTALIDGTGTGTINGNVTIQRYLNSFFGYKYLSSPFQSITVNAFSDYVDLLSSFPSFYKYDESKVSSGWVNYSTASGLLIPLKGYAANFGNSRVAGTINITGIVNNDLSSNIALYNHNQTYTKGFNLVGNPYPSPVDWNSVYGWTKQGVDNAIYFYNSGNTDQYSGTYGTYINGFSSDGVANNIIPAMQGFFIHVTDGPYPVTASFGMDNRVRVNNLSPVFHKALSTETRPFIKLSAIPENEEPHADPVIIYFDDFATISYNKELDAMKLMNTDVAAPNLYTISPDANKLAIAAIPYPDSLSVVPLGLKTEQDGWINFKADEIENMPPDLHIYFSDRETGINTELKKQGTIRLNIVNGTLENRFNLVFTKLILPENQSDNPGFSAYCSGNKLIVSFSDPIGMTGKLVISDLLGREILNKQMIGTGTHELFPDIKNGIYLLSFYSGKGIFTKKILINTQ